MSRLPSGRRRDWAAELAHLTSLTDTEAAQRLGCARSTVARVRRANPSLAGPKGRRPGARRAPSKAKVKGRRGRPPKGAETGRDRALTVRASEAELAQLAELATRQETTATDAVWAAVAQALESERR